MEKQHHISAPGGMILGGILLLGGIGLVIGAAVSPEKMEISGVSLQQNIDEIVAAGVPFQNVEKQQITNLVVESGGVESFGVLVSDAGLLTEPQPPDTAVLSETATRLNHFFDTTQLSLCVIAAPEAAEFYADSRLSGFPVTSQLEEIQSFYDALDADIRTIDAFHILSPLTDSYIYNRTDSRWTGYGAYCVYRVAIQRMGMTPISYDQYSVERIMTYRGGLYDMCQYDAVAPDLLDVYTCQDGVEITGVWSETDGIRKAREINSPDAVTKTGDAYAYYFGEDCEKIVLETDADTEKKLLLIKDSTANPMIPFLTQHFCEICIIDVTYATQPLENLVDFTEYSQALVLCDADTFADETTFSTLFPE